MLAKRELNIKNPCSQQWDLMQSLGDGRYCGSCNHIIHDFSELNNHDLLQMLQSGKYSCGRFDKLQMGTLYTIQKKNSERKKYWTAIAAAIISGMLQVSTSYTQTSGNEPLRMSKTGLKVNRYERKESVDIKVNNTFVTKEKFSFRVVDAETKQPLPFVRIGIMGISGTTDSVGRIDLEMVYNADEQTKIEAQLFLASYQESRVNLSLQACFHKLTVLYLRKKKLTQQKEYVVGFW